MNHYFQINHVIFRLHGFPFPSLLFFVILSKSHLQVWINTITMNISETKISYMRYFWKLQDLMQSKNESFINLVFSKQRNATAIS